MRLSVVALFVLGLRWLPAIAAAMSSIPRKRPFSATRPNERLTRSGTFSSENVNLKKRRLIESGGAPSPARVGGHPRRVELSSGSDPRARFALKKSQGPWRGREAARLLFLCRFAGLFGFGDREPRSNSQLTASPPSTLDQEHSPAGESTLRASRVRSPHRPPQAEPAMAGDQLGTEELGLRRELLPAAALARVPAAALPFRRGSNPARLRRQLKAQRGLLAASSSSATSRGSLSERRFFTQRRAPQARPAPLASCS